MQKVGQVSKPCPNLTLLPISEAVQSLVTLLEPRLPDKLMHPHEKVSDAVLVALEVLRVLHKHPYRSVWFTLILLNFYPNLPSYTQIYTRLERLGHLIETWHQAPESVEIAVVDSFPPSLPSQTRSQLQSALCLTWVRDAGQCLWLQGSRLDYSAGANLAVSTGLSPSP